MNENCKKYDDMSDVFEYGNISDDEIVKLCNQILLESKDEKNDIILETMYHAVFTAANYRNIADKIEIDSILDYIDYCFYRKAKIYKYNKKYWRKIWGFRY